MLRSRPDSAVPGRNPNESMLAADETLRESGLPRLRMLTEATTQPRSDAPRKQVAFGAAVRGAVT
jgi:hypothetical protein